MCFSQYAQYAPRPVLEPDYQYQIPARPQGAPPTKADLDENLFGPKPLPPEWQKPAIVYEGHSHNHTHSNGTQAAVEVAPQRIRSETSGLDAGVAAIVVELTNGTKLRISISQE
jgi:hypothetical protein